VTLVTQVCFLPLMIMCRILNPEGLLRQAIDSGRLYMLDFIFMYVCVYVYVFICINLDEFSLYAIVIFLYLYLCCALYPQTLHYD